MQKFQIRQICYRRRRYSCFKCSHVDKNLNRSIC